MPKRFTRSAVRVACLPLLLGAAAALGQPSPVPPPIVQHHADCARPQYASDALVCGDAALSAVDAEVGALAAALPATQPLRCNGAWQGRNLMASAAIAGQPIAIAENAAVLGIASVANPQWQPALAWRAAGHGIKLKVQDGRQFNCSPAHP